jgi:cobalt-precorrin 5A hydrolase
MGLLQADRWRLIAIGIGANSRAGQDEFFAALAESRRAAEGGDVVATLQDAVFANFVKAAAAQRSIAYKQLALEALRDRSNDCLTRSERTLSRFGISSVAEAAALAAAGPGSNLIVPRRIFGNVTVAAARSAGSLE